jgi:integrase
VSKRANGEGSIIEREDGKHIVRLSVRDAAGNIKRIKRIARNKTEARETLRQLQKQHQDGIDLTSGDLTVSIFLTRWLEDSVRPTVRQRTYENYESMVRVRLVPHIGGVKLRKLNPAIIQKMYTDLSDSGLSARSVHHTHRALHKAMKHALRQGMIARNPCEAVDPPRAQGSEMKTLSGSEVGVLLSGTEGERFHTLYVLAITSGLRMGELLGLRWSDVEFEKRRLFVRRSLQKAKGGFMFVEPKTAKSRRTVMLTDRALTALKTHRQHQIEDRLALGPSWNDQDLVFTSEIGGPMDPGNCAAIFKKALRRLELPDIRFHDLRHTCATLLLSAGTHPKIVSEMLGHSTIVLTLDTYSHVIPVMHSEAAETMERILG